MQVSDKPLINEKNISLESISKLTNSMASEMEIAIKTIQDINEETHILALNAAIEASSAGDAGKGFGVVADHMGNLSNETSRITKKMRQESQNKIIELEEILMTQATNVRGARLANLALTNIDLVDRSFYERSADVRWWAKDKSVVSALTNKGQNSLLAVSKRLNTILKFYSIYHDILLTNPQGIIISNGNPRYKLVGRDVSEREWFRSALRTQNGEQFGFDSVHKSPPLDNQVIVTFSCKVHQDADTSKPVVGVFASVFNWTGFAQKIIQSTPISEEERDSTRICIVDENGRILADSQDRLLENLEFSEREQLFLETTNFSIQEFDKKKSCLGHAISPGFEGYSTGWHSVIIQELKEN